MANLVVGCPLCSPTSVPRVPEGVRKKWDPSRRFREQRFERMVILQLYLYVWLQFWFLLRRPFRRLRNPVFIIFTILREKDMYNAAHKAGVINNQENLDFILWEVGFAGKLTFSYFCTKQSLPAVVRAVFKRLFWWAPTMYVWNINNKNISFHLKKKL